MNRAEAPLVEAATHATYQLSPTGSGRLRRLTAASGLANENVLSRVAIVTSLTHPAAVAPKSVSLGGKGKEIKGSTLLGRAGPASLMVAMIVSKQNHEVTPAQLRDLVVGHWERGLDMLNRESGGGSVVDLLATRLRAQPASGTSEAQRPGGHGTSSRDQVAAALGREFGGLPIEVRRLLAMVGRFDLGRARVFAQRLIMEASKAGAPRVSESQAMKVMADWGLNRLGMTARDRDTMRRILDATEGVPADSLEGDELTFLLNLGLVERRSRAGGSATFVAAAKAIELGKESWLQ